MKIRLSLKNTLLFVPMYNCEKQIVRVIDNINHASIDFGEVIIIDNCSSDNSIEVAKNTLKKHSNTNTKIFINSNNYGLGGSHKVAFNYFLSTSYDYIVVLHGDDQADITNIVSQVNYLGDFDCLLGSRFMENSYLTGYSIFRLIGNKALNTFLSLISGYKISDLGSGLNIYTKIYLREVKYLEFPNGLIFNVYLLFQALLTKSRIKFFPISWKDVDQVSTAKVISQGIFIILLSFKIKFNRDLITNPISNKESSKSYNTKVVYSSEK